MRKAGKLFAVGCAAALAGATVAGAGANAATVSDPIVTGLAGPLQFEVTGSSILVAQNFSGTLSRIAGDGTVTNLASFPGSDVGGVAQGKWGRTYFTTTGPDGALVRTRSKDGTVSTLADVGAYEAKKNPDANFKYGIRGIDADCIASLPEQVRPYQGIVESHPYAEMIRKSDFTSIIKADESVFGTSRYYLLDKIFTDYPEKAFLLEVNKIMTGYMLGRNGLKYNYMGPVVATSEDSARVLIAAALGKLQGQPVILDIPQDKIELIMWLESLGFQKQRHFTRMFLKSNSHKGITKNYYLISGPEYG